MPPSTGRGESRGARRMAGSVGACSSGASPRSLCSTRRAPLFRQLAISRHDAAEVLLDERNPSRRVSLQRVESHRWASTSSGSRRQPARAFPRSNSAFAVSRKPAGVAASRPAAATSRYAASTTRRYLLSPNPVVRHNAFHWFCQNSRLSRHGGKLTQKLGPG